MPTTIVRWTGPSGRNFTTRVLTAHVRPFLQDVSDHGGFMQSMEDEN